VGTQADAKKERFGREEALKLARRASRLVVARGKRVVRVDMTKAPPSDDELAALLLGPSGNLRAPALRRGTTLFIGFDPEAYREEFA
jgi:hypothetical protein